MRAVLQRVQRASVACEGEVIGNIGPGFAILLGVGTHDGPAEAAWLAQKTANLRVFEDEQGRFNYSLLDVNGEALVVSQFTLYGDARKGRRPSFTQAAQPEVAEPLIEQFTEHLRREGVRRVETGRFRAMMLVEIHNDGPVTIILDTDISRRGNVKRFADHLGEDRAGHSPSLSK